MSEPISLPRHGGGLVVAEARFGRPRDGWLDLSTGINPTPYPLATIDPAAFQRLPDPADLSSLIELARAAYGVADGVSIVAVPGSDIAIRLLPLVAPPGVVAILAPTYSAHDQAWRAASRAISATASLAAAEKAASIVVLANPNNPTGRITPPDALLALASRLSAEGGLLVVDEAFADLAPEISIVAGMSNRSALVFRSFGKFYGLAGLRLGFVIGPADIVEPLRRLIGDWPVSGPAIAAARQALADAGWQRAARQTLQAARRQLDETLARHGLLAIGGTDLFLLAAHPDARRLHEHLARAGIWTRVFANEQNWVRFGLPPAGQFARLDAALAAFTGALPPS